MTESDRYYEVRRTFLREGEHIEIIPKRVHIDTRPQLRRQTEEWMSAIDRLRTRVEALPSMRDIRRREDVERILSAWHADREREALRARLDALAGHRL